MPKNLNPGRVKDLRDIKSIFRNFLITKKWGVVFVKNDNFENRNNKINFEKYLEKVYFVEIKSSLNCCKMSIELIL